MTKRFTIGSILVLLFVVGCDSNRVFEEDLRIAEGVWDRSQLAKFEVPIEDTTVNYNLYLNFRHTDDYPYRNFYLFTHFIGPNGKTARDTAQMLLADSKGRWQGKGIGDIWDYQFLFKENFPFPVKGNYIFELEQAMRDEQIEGVTDVGIRLERYVPRKNN